MSIYILAVIYYSYITFLPHRFHSESTVLLAWVASWFCRYSFSSGKFLFEDSYSGSNTLLRWCCLISEQYRTSHCFCWRCALKSIIARHGLGVPRSPLEIGRGQRVVHMHSPEITTVQAYKSAAHWVKPVLHHSFESLNIMPPCFTTFVEAN